MNESNHSKNNPIVDLTYKFALDVTVIASLLRRKKENDLATQLWRAGTSIGANVEEAQAAQSRADFRSKMSIAAKEARETNYWLRLARDTRLLDPAQAKDIIAQIQSIMKILTSIVKSSSN